MNFKKGLRIITLWLALMLLITAGYNMFQSRSAPEVPAMAVSDLIQNIQKNKIKSVSIMGREALVDTRESKQYKVLLAYDRIIEPYLIEHKVRFEYVSHPPTPFAVSFFLWLVGLLLPIVLFFGVWYLFMRYMQGGGGNRAMGFGRTRAKMLDPQEQTVTFEDVAGVESAKDDLKEIVDFLKQPEKFKEIGGSIPKGVLLVGPPGTGKTLLAKAISGEAGVPFFSLSGSDFVELFVGVGASRVRDLFSQAKQHAPCIIFIDEIDAVGRQRGVGLGGGNDEREQTLNQLLVEMDGFGSSTDIIIIAATNRADVLDAALLRPGRFDRQVVVDLPSLRGRADILKVHLKKVKVGSDVDVQAIAKGTSGFSGADLANLVNESALRAARLGQKKVRAQDFEESRDKIIMGPERTSLAMTDEEKRLVAYHEAGHALTAYHCSHSDPIHKATIIPRGSALGMVVRLPETDRVSVGKQRLLDDLAVAMAGRVAEEMILGPEHVTTGASSDFQFATGMAFRMVREWGMSASMGLVNYAVYDRHDPWGKSADLSDAGRQHVEAEVKALVDSACTRVRSLLSQHRDQLDLLAATLLEHETLSGDEIRTLLQTGELIKSVEPQDVQADAEVSENAHPEASEAIDVQGADTAQGDPEKAPHVAATGSFEADVDDKESGDAESDHGNPKDAERGAVESRAIQSKEEASKGQASKNQEDQIKASKNESSEE
jgi:cell division protease FtsH